MEKAVAIEEAKKSTSAKNLLMVSPTQITKRKMVVEEDQTILLRKITTVKTINLIVVLVEAEETAPNLNLLPPTT